ncbi:response regulator [Halobacillus salinus]|uniref:Response regulator n=1 Tax=Halobacillus salinus TaxID=192814 RepID=A0A4Z0H4W8_9BACI|nr:response regulator [Halobacillus salinus]TGB04964.1 response regulator [Halobacillus salinus]
MIHVLIVEDDPMVADLNKKYVEQIKGFHVVGTAPDVEEALSLLEEFRVDLILLDVYMPGRNGLDLLREIRRKDEHVDVILITAASEKEQVQHSLRLGAVDYLIKPFEFNRLQKSLFKYQSNVSVLQSSRNVSQQELDDILSTRESIYETQPVSIPKGLTKTTLELIVEVISEREEASFSTDQIATAADLSRVSVRKYLKFLKDIDFLEETLLYGVGRPVYHYQRTGKQKVELDFHL